MVHGKVQEDFDEANVGQVARLQRSKCAPMVMEPSLTMAKLSGKLDELKDVIDVTCGATLTGSGITLQSGTARAPVLAVVAIEC